MNKFSKQQICVTDGKHLCCAKNWIHTPSASVFLCSQTTLLLYLDGKKESGEQPIPFLLSDPHNLGMLLIGADLNNKGLLTGENDACYLRPVTCTRIKVSSIKIFMLFLLFSVAKINAHTHQDMTSLRNKLKQLATCSHWHTNDTHNLL